MKRAYVWAMALCFAGALPSARAHAQQLHPPPDLPETIQAALRTEIAAAREAGLPTQPLLLKALEGRSKGATGEQIVVAVRALRERLRVSAEIFGTDRGDDVLEAGAAALYAGVEEKALRELARSTRSEVVGMALVVLGDLVRRGVPVGSAEQAVLSLGAAGADASALSDFRRSVDDDIRNGLAPKRAAEVRLRGMLARFGGSGGRDEQR